ncbi:MAG: SBBP repeat-containing protein [Nitrospirae bacterium]|nr:SBBP repeat-containing protein [Nitrospirota bacterium]
MISIRKIVASIVTLLVTGFCLGALAYANVPAGVAAEDNARIAESYGKLPIAFEANDGQTDPEVKYFARGQGYTLFMTRQEFVLSMTTPDKKQRAKAKIKTASIRIKFVNPDTDAKSIAGIDELPGKSSYFIGNDPEKWRTNVPTYKKVKYEKVYPGVDLVVYGNQRQIEYDFVVAPNADYNQIALKIDGVKTLKVDKDGNLIIAAKGGKMLMHKPLVYQEIDGVKKEIKGKYHVGKDNLVSFNVAGYDRNKALVIDPTLAYSTFLGGSSSGSSGDFGRSIAVDSQGNAYVTGFTTSTDFPVTTGAVQTTIKGTSNLFITKLNSAGTALVYSTYLGGSSASGDIGRSIAVDSAGNAYVTGETYSTDFPTAGAYQTTMKGVCDVFITKLNSTGTALVYSTYLGGNGYDGGYGIAVDSSGNAYVTGYTRSTDFPVTSGAFQTTVGGDYDVFVAKLNAAGTALAYSTFLGGRDRDYGYGIAVDSSGNAYVTGQAYSTDFPVTTGAYQTTMNATYTAFGTVFSYGNAFITKLNSTGTALVYSTYLGGTKAAYGTSIAVDASGNSYVTGDAYSTDFPTTAGAYQTALKGLSGVFITKLNSTGSALVYSTFLAGNSSDDGSGIAVDSSGNAYVTGYAVSSDFPTTTGAYQTTLKGASNVFITKLNSTGTALVYSTLLGGSNSSHGDLGAGIAIDSSGDAYVTGYTTSSDFPATTGAYQTTLKGTYDVFIAKLQFSSSISYTLSVSKSGSGTITSSPSGISCGSACSATYASGTSVTLTATPASGYTFSSWSGCDSTSGSQCTVALVSNKSVSAVFSSSSSSYTLSVSKTGSGTVTSSPSGISCGSACSATYASGTAVTLTAAAASGYTFSSWSGCDSTSGSQCTVTLVSAKSVTAAFTSSIMPDSDAASAAFNAIYSQYVSWFGSTSGGIQTGTSWIAYYQLYTNGAYLVAGTDGNMYTYYNGQLYSLGITWKTFGYAASKISSIYSQYASWFGSTSGSISAGTSGSATYYIQWYSNGAALVAWTDGYMYSYYNGTSYALGVRWR